MKYIMRSPDLFSAKDDPVTSYIGGKPTPQTDRSSQAVGDLHRRMPMTAGASALLNQTT
jgi:hypothetical protein